MLPECDKPSFHFFKRAHKKINYNKNPQSDNNTF